MWGFSITDSCSLITHKQDVLYNVVMNQITAVISVDLEMMQSLHLHLVI